MGLGGQIYVLDQLHGLECFCMGLDRWYSASHMGGLDELLEDELELDELEEQLGELDEDGLELGELYEQLGE